MKAKKINKKAIKKILKRFTGRNKIIALVIISIIITVLYMYGLLEYLPFLLEIVFSLV